MQGIHLHRLDTQHRCLFWHVSHCNWQGDIMSGFCLNWLLDLRADWDLGNISCFEITELRISCLSTCLLCYDVLSSGDLVIRCTLSCVGPFVLNSYSAWICKWWYTDWSHTIAAQQNVIPYVKRGIHLLQLASGLSSCVHNQQWACLDPDFVRSLSDWRSSVFILLHSSTWYN